LSHRQHTSYFIEEAAASRSLITELTDCIRAFYLMLAASSTKLIYCL